MGVIVTWLHFLCRYFGTSAKTRQYELQYVLQVRLLVYLLLLLGVETKTVGLSASCRSKCFYSMLMTFRMCGKENDNYEYKFNASTSN